MSERDWNISITFQSYDGMVGALARLEEGPLTAVGRGRVVHGIGVGDLGGERAVAAQRALEDLGAALTYLVRVDRLARADQA